MTTLSLTEVRKDRFALTPSFDSKTLTVRFSGTGDTSAAATLALFLSLVHRETQRLGVREVAFDVRDLAFLNSSCLKSFVTWIDNVSNLDAAGRYRIRFLSNPRIGWQRRSLEALRSLGGGVVSVET